MFSCIILIVRKVQEIQRWTNWLNVPGVPTDYKTVSNFLKYVNDVNR